MPRILGIDIPKDKHIDIALSYLYGIGRVSAKAILKKVNIDPNRRAKDLTDEEVNQITQAIQKGYKAEGDLRRDVNQNIRRLIAVGTYRGLRHRRGLPVRGQRTRTNSRTRKGPRKTTAGITTKAPDKKTDKT